MSEDGYTNYVAPDSSQSVEALRNRLDDRCKDDEYAIASAVAMLDRYAAILKSREETKAVAPKVIGWRTPDYLFETADRQTAIGWASNIGALPIFDGDAHTKLTHPPASRFR